MGYRILITAAFLVPCLFVTLIIAAEPNHKPIDRSKPFYMAFVDPFKEFFTRKGVAGAIGLILFIFLYKLGDSLQLRYKPNLFWIWVLLNRTLPAL
ncbi:muropeptide transporter [Mannheimia haemolytica]|uniref:Muropeptide transporter n=1 Tax=Mannheimia haemolytica TaxID=75985 RepID=A0A378MWH3_MANHA|nr:muropeptide transporter [Mannheimia haemolytica]